MMQHQADVIALQELDLDGEESRWPDMLQAFEAAGYSGVRAKKLDRACDGVALLWCCKSLRPMGRAEVWPLRRGSVHVALAQRLQSLDGRMEFLAVTTHLKAGMTELAERERYDQFKALYRQICRTKPRLPTMVLADLNSHCRDLQGDCGQTVKPLVYDYFSSNGFRSFPKEVIGNEMQFTCWGGWQGYDVSGVFDYILSFEEHLGQDHQLLHPLRVLTNPPPADVCKYLERLPNKDHPSDHVPVLVDFLLLPANSPAGSVACADVSGYGSSAAADEELLAGPEPKPVDIEPEPVEDLVEMLVPVPKQMLGRVIGKQGLVIKGIRNRSGASRIEAWDQSVDPCQVTVRGSGIFEVERAREMILEIVQGAASSNGTTPTVTKPGSSSPTAYHASKAAIGGDEAVANGVPRNYKTAMCKYFQQNMCTKGSSCSFAHGEEELRQIHQTNLYVCNLPSGADESTLKQVFEAYGIISSLRVLGEKGVGFVRYSTQQEAERAIENLNGLQYDSATGMRLTVKYANNHHT